MGAGYGDDRIDISRRAPAGRAPGRAVRSSPDRRGAGHRLLNTKPEPPFDDLAEIAAAITGCERAFITLVDEDRSFWKSCVGVDLQQTGVRQIPARESFCYFLVGLGDRFVVEDAARTRAPVITPLSRR